ncbi:hypothetical protein [Haloarcula salinisoli]|uniref:Uncharacterized protein n=1 Tax=Haloarcula salinisoli TaxID=2487746 RepID=A0A8J7YDU0_9EURY|nr:hypothetical protein [Halomicroarcula salinisoli]MBX0284885.1 hypothetical protein [Halomicroarcula salinisoli]MBX0303637.1 hypothetical protein [Halomicroarcula salinisoli]
MPSRRAVLSLVAGGTLALAGCGGSAEGTERDFGLTTTGAEGVPGQAVGVELTARGLGVLTYRVDALPSGWQVTQGDFDPGPTSVREMYPPELLWEPPIGTVTGSFIVEIGPKAAPGDYSLPVEARAGDSGQTTVSTAVITVEGPTQTPTKREPTGTQSPRNSTGSPSPQQQSPSGTD